MIKVIKKYKNTTLYSPVPKSIRAFIDHCDKITGSSDIRKYTRIILQTSDSKQHKYRGLCYQLQYKIVVYTKKHNSLWDIFDTIAHEMVHLMTRHVCNLTCQEDHFGKGKTGWDNSREEFLAETISNRLVQTFMDKHYALFYKEYNDLIKYFGIKNE